MRDIILDCDPGHDDAIAIMLAAKNSAINLLGISVVAGNHTLEKTLENTLHICQYLNLQIPVYAGCGHPIVRSKQVIADDIHGKSGLDGPCFPALTKKAESVHAVTFIIDSIRNSEKAITLVPTGPLTNIAMAIRLAPDILEKIDTIILMGGSMGRGNVTPAAEFNIFADAEAAHIVFSSGVPIVMVGLDVTTKAQCFPSIIDRMSKTKNKASILFQDLMTFFNTTQKKIFGWEGSPLHDPITIAYLINPKVLKTKCMYATVDYHGVESYGRTNCDYFGRSEEKPNVQVAVDIDVDLFWQIIENGIGMYE